ncbi:MAG: DUF3313 domain-containing protein [Desulfarculaceae bacterium]|nr:DUF3313 domain-containing protein [Desulfarculaceae bacterium]MCF8070942.1 DUF3313 domain-containing protein [Desulfarculaceae bacterium]MCF8100530.1 DUF3313 domain-containing protein [Desulfarculaceae bacterium]MCF8116556.1 DUF3313 domain-containing protein [Desulfarculaceae bacterium]
MKRLPAWLPLLAALVLLLGLGAACGTAPKVPPSGFLSDYEALKPDPDVDGLYWWARKGVDWANYRALLIDPVEVRVSKSSFKDALEPGEAKVMAKKLRDVTVRALMGNYPLARHAAPGVLRLKAALVHLKPVQPAVNVVSSALLMVPVDVGEAAVEVQFTDSVSGRIQGELVISNQGSIAQVTKVWTRWAQVDDAFVQWALLLREAMRQK